MNEQEYIKTRVDDQLEWYDNKSKHNKNRYLLLRLVVIICSVSIPLMTGFISEERAWLKIAVGVTGVVIAGLEGIQSLYKYHENWLNYRNATEFLSREKLFYATKSGPYAENGSLQHLVERVESFTSEENQKWTAISRKNQTSQKKS